MAITLVANTFTYGNINGDTTGAINSAGSSLIVISVSAYGPYKTNVVVTDSKSNTWTPLNWGDGTGTYPSSTRLYYCDSPTVGSGHTFTLSGTAYQSCQVQCFSGTGASSFDQQNGAGSGNSTTTIAAGSITPTQNNELVVAGLGASDNTTTFTINASFTITDQVPWHGGGRDAEGGAMAYLVQTTAAAVNPTWTSAVAASYGISAVIASFKSSGGGGPAFIAAAGLNIRQAIRRASVW